MDGLLTSLPTFLLEALYQQGYSPAQIGLYTALIGLAGYVVSPLLVFLVMFFLARGLDLSTDFVNALLSLFVGSLAGLYAGSLTALGLFFATFQSLGFFVVFAVAAAPGAVHFTLVGFASLALGYFFRRPKVADVQSQTG